jgi:hypothetical protein
MPQFDPELIEVMKKVLEDIMTSTHFSWIVSRDSRYG